MIKRPHLSRLTSLIMGLCLGAHSLAYADGGKSRDQDLKTAFIYNFARFSKWPKAKTGGEATDVTICISADAPLTGALQSLHGKPVGSGGKIEVRVYDEPDDTLHACAIVFLTRSEMSAARLSFFEAHHILTVSDTDDFVRGGGAIGLVKIGRQLRFEINLSSAQRAEVRLNSRLIRLAINLE